jgi:hypothetical protein
VTAAPSGGPVVTPRVVSAVGAVPIDPHGSDLQPRSTVWRSPLPAHAIPLVHPCLLTSDQGWTSPGLTTGRRHVPEFPPVG